MFFGPQESFFGIGAPEFALIAAVGYFVLGPTELYKLSKQIGTVIGQFREFGVGTVTNFQSIMEKQLAEVENVKAGRKSTLDSLWGNADDDEDDEEEYEEIFEDGESVDGPAPEPAGAANVWGFRANEPAKASKSDESEEDVADYEYLDGVPLPYTKRAPAAAAATAETAGVVAGIADAPPLPKSRFASQLSGQWNEKIMAQGPAEAGGAAAAAAGVAGSGLAVAAAATEQSGGGLAHDVPQDLSAAEAEVSIDEQFRRLEAIAQLEDERASVMQRLEQELDKRLKDVRRDMLSIVDEDFAKRRRRVESDFSRK